MSLKLGWTATKDLKTDTVTFVHRCLRVSQNISASSFYVSDMTHNLKRWVDNAWEQKQKSKRATISLQDMCIPGTILTLAAAVEKLESLDDRLPAEHKLARDWQQTVDGRKVPDPQINTWEIPDATEMKDTLEQIRNVFEWILRIMQLLEAAVSQSFWAEVAHAQGGRTQPSPEHIHTDWLTAQKFIQDSLDHIESFTAVTETPAVAESPAAVREPLKTEAHFTILMQRLRQSSV